MSWCSFGFHKWSKWVDFKSFEISESRYCEMGRVGMDLIQTKVCDKCGLRKLKTAKVRFYG